MADKNTVEVENREVAEAEAALKKAEAARDEAYRRANDPGELGGAQGSWKRLPLDEPTAAALRSDADWRLKQARWALAKAKCPRLPLAEAQASLARAETHVAECRARVAQVMEEKNSDDRVLVLRAGRGEKEVIADLLDAEINVEVAHAVLKNAEAREVDQRKPVFELRAVALARQIDEKLDALAAIVAAAVELGEQARAVGVPFDPPTYVGALPERLAHWRAQNAGRLVREP